MIHYQATRLWWIKPVADESAFATLINQHRSLVFGIIWAVLRDADDTEDATQETFILAYRNLSQLDDVGKFSSWLCTIARNVARN